MRTGLAVVLVLAGLCPVVSTSDAAVLASLVPILAAAGLGAVALATDSAGLERIGERGWPLGLAAVLAFWILLQLLPLPISSAPPLAWVSGLVHPVWISAADALQQPIAGRITVDTGATAVALVDVLSLAGVALLTLTVTIDRDRAELVLLGLTIAAAAIAAAPATAGLLGAAELGGRAEALDAACLGLVLAAACGALAYEPGSTRRSKRDRGLRRRGLVGLVAAVAFLVCFVAILAAHSGAILFAATSGLATFCVVVLVRRLALGRWGAVTIGATAVVVGVALGHGAAGSNPDPRFAFVRTDPVSLELTQRILADAPGLGTGAGTFSALVPIYRPSDTGTASPNAVTAAARISIELGRPMLWLCVTAAVAAALWLLRGALRRGRDYLYPAVGSASLVTLTLLAFVNVGLFAPALSLLAAMVLGLALAQAKGSEPAG
jgi:hypothetical protein